MKRRRMPAADGIADILASARPGVDKLVMRRRNKL